ncbi:MAG: BACON domain-containing protein [Bacteroides sp.]|nr:BACON domain-containing protein [Bacteroides sp.]
MKHLLKIALGIIACAGLLASCDDDENTISGFSLDKQDITVGAEGGTEEINIQSDAEWVAIASEPWVTVSPANGIGSTVCTVSIDTTLVNDLREATIRFTPSGQTATNVSVRQTGYGKIIHIDEPELEIESTSSTKYFDAVVTTNIKSVNISVEYENGDESWLTTTTYTLDLTSTVDRGARPRTTKIRFNWKLNPDPEVRIAKVNFTSADASDVLENPAVLTVTQKAAPKIEDNRAGDSLALLLITEQMGTSGWDTSENMRNWDDVGLWEATDKDLPCEEAIGRVRSVLFTLFNTTESLPQEVHYLTYLESLTFQSNTNTMLKSIALESDICNLKYLKKLKIMAYGLVSLPDDFKNLGSSLESLDLSSNNFKDIPSILTPENFPKLKALYFTGNRRWDTTDLRKEPNYDNGLGFHIDLETSETLKRLFLWNGLDTLRLSYNYIEGHLPDFEVGKDGVEAYTQEDIDTFGGDTIQYLLGKPKIMPNMKWLSINLNFLTGNLPEWILYHPHLLDWYPETLIFNQMENGRDSDGNVVKFDNEPKDFEYYYTAFPKFREKYEFQEIEEEE